MRIRVGGVVQGVGFRPFVYRLAHEHDLKGWVRNTSGNVEIEVYGDEDRVKNFLVDLEAKAPPLARIRSIDITSPSPQSHTKYAKYKKYENFENFEIRESTSQEGQYQLVSPDIATCEDCLREIFSPADRRYRYPFTNCTNCGPRFTIIEDIPYDRPKTTMRKFQMCPQCQQEYDNPLDRRFHAQPNACPRCGPGLSLVDSNGKTLLYDDVIKAAGELLSAGSILALRGLGGFQLACDATNEEAINLLRRRKRRASKPFAVMMATLEDSESHCFMSPKEGKLLNSPECPIVLLSWKLSSSTISPAVAPNLKYLGIMLPYTPLHHLLLRESATPLVMTSGNLSEEPIAKDNDEGLRRLGEIADYFLIHNRDIHARYDDSVFFMTGTPQSIRRARGYAPYPIPLPFQSKQVLACGPELKNTFCLSKDNNAFLSQHIGDMENEETLEHFENTIDLYKKLFRIVPEAIAHDMHPEYLSTKYAIQAGTEQGLNIIPVQHHHAHIVSCMVENGVEGPVIGIAFDGAGYGSDSTIWGGEFLLADWRTFQRAGHLEYVPLLGGEAAIKKPYRMALSYLYTLLGEQDEKFSLEGLPMSNLHPAELALLKQQLTRRINCPLTSSAGRLFDAVAALIGVREEIDYEAQAAIELEMLAADERDNSEGTSYPFSIIHKEGLRVIKLGGLFSALINDVKAQVPTPIISLRFHKTVAQIILEMCKLITGDTGITQVALSGGVFQNRLLLRLATAALQRDGFKVLTHHLVPCNDGGISLGQAVIANFELAHSDNLTDVKTSRK
ncbi:MAG: carbamoyltransferase HypF [Dehalococcoidia bacterium]|nr:carbamoyltransferase HypF [Dehalococcoidia bacterium]